MTNNKNTPSQPPPYQGEEQIIQDNRLVQIHHWLKAELQLHEYHLEPASADASFRRYFRVFTDQQTLIVMDAPPDKEDCAPFIDIANRLITAGVNAPEIKASNFQKGFLALSDLGNTMYLDVLTEKDTDRNADQLYKAAIDALIIMQSKTSTENLPDYDKHLLLQEMELFRDWLIQKHLNLPAPGKWLEDIFHFLAQSALAQPQIFVHRDYHSRNLTCLPENLPGILDFQDAMLGPVSYDLVSLLRDCYIQWPATRVNFWVDYYYQEAKKVNLLEGHSKRQFEQWFNLMGIQRHLKASGIFARLLHRDGKEGYLKDIPRTLEYIVQASTAYSELQPLNQFIQDLVLPQMEKKK